MKKLITIAILLICIACGKQKNEEKRELFPVKKIEVITVNYPLYYFSERIGGDLIDLKYVIPENVDPAYWEPNQETLNVYQESDIILDHGIGYAKWMNKVSLPSSRIFNTTKSVEDQLISSSDKTSHNHGPEGEHEHENFQITTWLNFKLALTQAESVRNILQNKLPKQQKILAANFKLLKKDLIALDEKMVGKAHVLKTKNMIASHPVYQYLSKEYGLHIHSVHFEPEDFPSEKQWKNLKKLMKSNKPNMMLWEVQPISEIADKLKDLDIEIVVFDPCANRPVKGDFLTVMTKNIERFK